MYDVVFVSNRIYNTRIRVPGTHEAPSADDIRGLRNLQRAGTIACPDWLSIPEDEVQGIIGEGEDRFVRCHCARTTKGPDDSEGWWLCPYAGPRGAEMTQTCRTGCKWTRLDDGIWGGSFTL